MEYAIHLADADLDLLDLQQDTEGDDAELLEFLEGEAA